VVFVIEGGGFNRVQVAGKESTGFLHQIQPRQIFDAHYAGFHEGHDAFFYPFKLAYGQIRKSVMGHPPGSVEYDNSNTEVCKDHAKGKREY
jgi:hypothetical protein